MGYFPLFILASLLLINNSVTKSAALAFPESKPNTTKYDETIGEFIEDEEQVVLFGESEVKRRRLAADTPISYRGLQRQPVCNAYIYGNCIKPAGPDYRPCTTYNRCKRGVK
ncbi:hypothetical protein ERO13_A07G079500v2 [Gossypium hirsutum]|uniref:Protein RALF-like 27 n=1 Tax=Gossypium hirsutum TaxID=3635 RepID=A0A1U8NYV1_GOSHI|nr:protein RALF-like 27 [Gossypium hirsutum]KAG4191244.1 hypothetical protein ERO13_A07G079500v2 [Gossypium hirsutum]